MANFINGEKEWAFNYTNEGEADLDQYHLVLDPYALQIGYIPDPEGIAAGETKKIKTDYGQIIDVDADQLAAEMTDLTLPQQILMQPGSGTLHVTEAVGDYVIGVLDEDQSSDDFIRVRTIIPFPIEANDT